jgi:8-oxo-dGTP diphosphatase
VVSAALLRDGCLLAARRTEPPALAGGWELPGGKVEPGETDEEALVREIREELGVDVALGARVGGDWPLGRYVMRVWLATVAGGGEPAAVEQHDAVTWVRLDDIGSVEWLPGDREPAEAAARLAREAAAQVARDPAGGADAARGTAPRP